MQNYLFRFALVVFLFGKLNAADLPAPLTPESPSTPRINGPGVFGVRPGSALLYTVPAAGDRPMTFGADNLPAGLKLDAATGHFTGKMLLHRSISQLQPL